MASKKTDSVKFTSQILKFGVKGEKSGWTYIEIPTDVAAQLFPGNKKSFRVKGLLDHHPIRGVALLPMGKGTFILPLNATIRKVINKSEGAMLRLQLQADFKKLLLNFELLKCLEDEPEAFSFFKELPKSHQHYFSKWIDSAKTQETKVKRISRTLKALSQKMHYVRC